MTVKTDFVAGDPRLAADVNEENKLLLSLPFIPVNTAVKTDSRTATINGIGDVMFQRSGSSQFFRYIRRGSGGFLKQDGSIAAGFSNFDGVVGIGTQFVYKLGTGARIIDDDGTGDAALTISGGSWTGNGRIGTDGTFVYIQDVSVTGTTIKKYSLSGTTLTFVNDRTLSAIPASGDLLSFAVNNDLIQTFWLSPAKEFRTYGESTGTQSELVSVVDNLSPGHAIVNGRIFLFYGRGTSAGEQPEFAGWMQFDLTV